MEALIVHVRNKLTKSLIDDYEKSKEEALEIAKVESEEIFKALIMNKPKDQSSSTE